MANFPKKLFVKREDYGVDESYWAAADDLESLAGDVGGNVHVATYELVSTGRLASKAQYQADKARAIKKRV